jgi:hypothetical protein
MLEKEGLGGRQKIKRKGQLGRIRKFAGMGRNL